MLIASAALAVTGVGIYLARADQVVEGSDGLTATITPDYVMKDDTTGFTVKVTDANTSGSRFDSYWIDHLPSGWTLKNGTTTLNPISTNPVIYEVPITVATSGALKIIPPAGYSGTLSDVRIGRPDSRTNLITDFDNGTFDYIGQSDPQLPAANTSYSFLPYTHVSGTPQNIPFNTSQVLTQTRVIDGQTYGHAVDEFYGNNQPYTSRSLWFLLDASGHIVSPAKMWTFRLNNLASNDTPLGYWENGTVYSDHVQFTFDQMTLPTSGSITSYTPQYGAWDGQYNITPTARITGPLAHAEIHFADLRSVSNPLTTPDTATVCQQDNQQYTWDDNLTQVTAAQRAASGKFMLVNGGYTFSQGGNLPSPNDVATTTVSGLDPDGVYLFSGYLANIGYGGTPIPVNAQFFVDRVGMSSNTLVGTSNDLPLQRGCTNTGVGMWTPASGVFAPLGASSVKISIRNNSNAGVGNDFAIDQLTLYPLTMVSFHLDVRDLAPAVLKIDKSDPAESGPYVVGSTLTYTLTVKNAGEADATNVVVKDLGGQGMTGVSLSDASAGSVSGTSWTIPTLAAGATATATAHATIASGATGTARNSVQVSGDGLPAPTLDPSKNGDDITPNDTVDGDDDQGDRVDVPLAADLKIDKSLPAGAPATYSAGDTVSYTVTVKNAGGGAAANVVVNDLGGGNLTVTGITPATGSGSASGSTWTIGSLAAGASATATVEATIAASPTGAKARNIVVVAGDGLPAPTPGSDADSDGLTGGNIVPNDGVDADTDRGDRVDVGIGYPTLKVDKAVSSTASSYGAGDTVSYTLTVKNSGGGSAKNVVVSDLGGTNIDPSSITFSGVPEGTTVDGATHAWSVGTLAAGASMQVTVQAKVVAAPAGAAARNIVVVAGDGLPAPVPGSDTGSDGLTGGNIVPNDGVDADTDQGDRVDVPLAPAALKIDKSQPAGPVNAGATLTYTVTVKNAGGTSATNVKVDDLAVTGLTVVTLSAQTQGTVAGATWTVGTLAPGATATVTVTAKVDDGAVKAVRNIVVVSGDGLPARTPGGDTDGDGLTGDDIVPNDGVDADTDQGDRVDVALNSPVLKIHKTGPTAPVNAGDTVAYQVTVKNAGGTQATHVTVEDVASPGLTVTGLTDPSQGTATGSTWQVGTLAGGATATVTVTATVDKDALKAVRNIVVAGADGLPAPAPGGDKDGDGLTGDDIVPNATLDGDDDQGDRVDVPLNSAVLKVDKSQPTGIFHPGGTVTYTVTAANTGGSRATDVVVTDIPLTGLTDVVLSKASEGAVIDGLTVTAASLEAGGQVTFTVTGRLADDASGAVRNVVTVQGTSGDGPLPAPDPGPDGSGVTPNADLASDDDRGDRVDVPVLVVTKTADPVSDTVMHAGQTVAYTLSFVNDSPIDIAGVDYVDYFTRVLDDATITSAPVSSDPRLTVGYTPGGTSFTVRGTVAGNTTVTVTYTVTVKSDAVRLAAGSDNLMLNFLQDKTHCPEGGCTEPTTVAECATPSVCVSTSHPVLAVAKSVDPADSSTVSSGQKLTYTITFTNKGDPSVTGDVVKAAAVDYVDILRDVLDDAAWDDTLTASGGLSATFDPATGTIAISGSVDPETVGTVTFTVTVKSDADRLAGGGNAAVDNFVMPSDECPDGECVPPPCQPDDPLCTSNSILEVLKAVSPVDGSTVKAGQVITYLLSFDNSRGSGPVGINYVDFLNQVLDDADLTAGPVASGGAVVTRAGDGLSFTVTGTVPAGKVATVQYAVTVRADGARGDSDLKNFVMRPDDDQQCPGGVCPVPTPETTCQAGDPLCTEHPVIVVVKSADPADGSSVHAGQSVVFTISFTNQAKIPATISYDDLLTGILDDADWSGGPTVAGDGLSASRAGDVLHITGAVPPGTTTSVSYTVVIRPDGQRGDSDVLNFVITGKPAPSGLKIDKSQPAGPVHPGDKVTYTVTVKNAGADPVTGVQVDDLGGHGLTVTGLTAPSQGIVLGLSSWHVGTLAAGATATVTVTATVDQGAAGVARNSVQVSAPGLPAPDPGLDGGNITPNDGVDSDTDQSDRVDVDIAPAPGSPAVLQIDKTQPSGRYARGDQVSYVVFVANNGGSDATGVVVDDLGGTGLTDLVLGAPPSGTSVDAGRWTIGTLPAGRTLGIAVTATIAPDAVGSARNTVVVSGTDTSTGDKLPAPDPGDNGSKIVPNDVVGTDTDQGDRVDVPVDTCAVGDPQCTEHSMVAVLKTAVPISGSTVLAGDTITYTLQFTNTATVATSSLNYADYLSQVLDDATWVSGQTITVTGGVEARYDPAAQTVSVTGTLPAGAKATVSYQVVVKPDEQRKNSDLKNFVMNRGDAKVCPGGVCPEPGPDTVCLAGDPTCTHHAALLVEKTASPADQATVRAGDRVRYTLTFTNPSTLPATVGHTDLLARVLDDATLDKASIAATSGLTATVSGSVNGVGEGDPALTVTGVLPAGTTGTVGFDVVVKADGSRGDSDLMNFLVRTPPGGGTPEPPPTCQPGDRLCTEHPMVDVRKTADPASGTTLVAGDTVAYTLRFTNTGTVASTNLHFVDFVNLVLDDATWVSGPTTTGGIGAVLDAQAGTVTVTGTLAPQGVGTVTYTVRVNPDGARGDSRMANFVVDKDDQHACPEGKCPPPPPETVCQQGDPRCTAHPVLGVTKSVDPADGSTVRAGDVLTYTLTFANPAGLPATVAYDDLLAGLLDDADLTGSIATTGGLTAALASPVIHVTGTLAGGTTGTVVFRAVVKPDAQRGDSDVLNFLARVTPSIPHPTLPQVCAAGDPLCTEQPAVVMKKTADPVTRSLVKAGDVITYTLTFTNTANIPAQVDAVDLLQALLDDATVTRDPQSGSLTVRALTGGGFWVTGTLPAHSYGTVTYQATVKADGQRGDSDVFNFVMLTPRPNDKTKPWTPTNPPALPSVPVGPDSKPLCVPGDVWCTEHPVLAANTPTPFLRIAKVSDPPDGTAVKPGQVIAYTITAKNMSDKVPIATTITDNLANATPYATFNTASLRVSKGVALLSTTTLTWRGTLAPGETLTITYTMTVHDNAVNGQNVENTVVADTGADTNCDTTVTTPSDQCRTGNPIVVPAKPPIPFLPLLPGTGSQIVSGFVVLGFLLIAVGGFLVVRNRRRNVRQG